MPQIRTSTELPSAVPGPAAGDSTNTAMPRLTVHDLRSYFFTREGIVKAVDGVDLVVGDRETVGVIGESGCGKSVMAHSLLRLVRPPGEIVAGQVLLKREDEQTVDILALEPRSPQLRSIRGGEIAMVFQEPMTSFSPVHSVGRQVAEMISTHVAISRAEARSRVVDLFARVGISNPQHRYDEYPHQMSGGMRQRAMIAMALANSPRVIIADEPTTALDVTIQAQILELMKELQDERDMSTVFITHNMGLIAEQVDRVYVMYLGRVVESATTDQLFANPSHPYTRKLLQAVPRPGRAVERLETIEGTVPTPIDLPRQCGFASRCQVAIEGRCDTHVPAMREIEDGHFVRCFLHSDVEEDAHAWANV
jgi:peptide/nickel transport system ATP-binding protein